MFELRKVAFDDYVMQLKLGNDIFQNPDLVAKIGEQYFTWKTAVPIIMASVLYGRPLPNDVIREKGKSVNLSSNQINAQMETSDPDTNSIDQRKNTSWWPFGSKGGNGSAAGQEGQVQEKSSPDRDIAAAFAAAAGSSGAEVESAHGQVTSTPQGNSEPTSEANKADQVDNRSCHIIIEQQIGGIDSSKNSDPIAISPPTTELSIIMTEESAEMAIEKVSSVVETGASLLGTTPSRPSRNNVDVSTSSDGSNHGPITNENITGKFKKTLRLSTDCIVSTSHTNVNS